jgi:penicillin-binding protein 2
MLLRPEMSHLKWCSALFLMVFLFAPSSIQAQTKKSANKKPTAAKKTEKTAKDAKKESASTKKEKLSAKDKAKQAESKKKETADKNKDRQANLKKKDSAKEKDTAKTKESKKASENRRAEQARRRAEELERKKAEEARRQAILAEKRRREQAAREARARALAFERGLRTETIENIANDNTEGEDPQIRRAAIAALGNHAGTVVVMEAQTGKILTVVNQDWAVRNSYRPCSTIKLVTGVAGLNENVINGEGNVGNFRMNLDDALAYSNNVYFQKVGANIGNTKIISYARTLGLGEPTGVNYEGEVSGKLPYNNNKALIYSHGDDFEVSPMQLAVMVSAISNGGKVVVPQVARAQTAQASFRGYLRRQVNLPASNLTGVIPGMVGAAQYGTARRGVDASMGVAGKTGSCIGKGTWLGLFASVAPVQNPKYSVVVITRGQAERGKYAAAVAGRVYQALRPRLNEKSNERNIALTPFRIAPKSQISAKTPVLDLDEEEEGDEAIEAEGGDTPERAGETAAPKTVTSVNSPAPKTEVKKAEKIANMFPPVVIKVKKPEGESTRPRVVTNK